MSKIEVVLPKMGESVAEATVTTLLKNIGDKVEAEDAIIEIATDKVDTEVPAPYDGTIVELLCKEGDVVQVGQVVAIIDAEGVSETSSSLNAQDDVAPSAPIEEENYDHHEALDKIPGSQELNEATSPSQQNEEKRFYSPLIKNIAKIEGITEAELQNIPGTGKNGRLTKNDLLSYLKDGKKTATQSAPEPATQTKPTTPPAPSFAPAKSVTGQDDIIEMDRMRKLIADNMIKSKQISAHVTSMVEIDVTGIVMWRNKVKDEFLRKEGFKLTFTPIFIEAVAKALRDFPMINISIDGDKIIVKKDINIGMAVALPTGNLIVPVVKNADQLNITGLAGRVNDLSSRARNNKLSMDDIEGGTFTLTNIGTFGNAIGTPIINQPEVAIMSTGIIKKKPAVIETPLGDSIGIRHMMYLSMSYDHRVVDGMLGGSFIKRVADYLESFDINRQIW